MRENYIRAPIGCVWVWTPVAEADANARGLPPRYVDLPARENGIDLSCTAPRVLYDAGYLRVARLEEVAALSMIQLAFATVAYRLHEAKALRYALDDSLLEPIIALARKFAATHGTTNLEHLEHLAERELLAAFGNGTYQTITGGTLQ